MNTSEIHTWSNELRYRLLDRIRSDCEYYLGCGNRAEKYLWTGNVAAHIEHMKAIWNSLPDDCKPVWLTYDEILEYERLMT